jgi:hypothetical protein
LTHSPTPQQILRLGEQRLATFFQKHNTTLGTETATRIIHAARAAPSRPEEDLPVDRLALDCHLQTVTLVEAHLIRLEAQMAAYLLATPGVYLLSVPGISTISAADVTAEVGDISRFASANPLIALAGTCAKKEQSGQVNLDGLPMSKQGRTLLRATLNQIALSLNAPCSDDTRYYQRKHLEKQDRPKIAAGATGNTFVHVACAFMKHEQLYKPPAFNTLGQSEQEYAVQTYHKMVGNIHPYLKDLPTLPEPNIRERTTPSLAVVPLSSILHHASAACTLRSTLVHARRTIRTQKVLDFCLFVHYIYCIL